MAKEKEGLKKGQNKWLSRKWIMGMASLLSGVVLAILDDNDIFSTPWYVIVLLILIALTWLIAEGYLDRRALDYLKKIGVLNGK